jgi:ferredoxin
MRRSLKNKTKFSNDAYTEIVDKFRICDFSFIPMQRLESRERSFFHAFMPGAKTAITVYYPVKTLSGWNWYLPDGKLSGERCDIDDRCREVCGYIRDTLIKKGMDTQIVPYPQNSGLQFRFVAAASGIGEIGKNRFYLHPGWGSRVHLRVLATDMESEPLCSIMIKTNKVCLDCGKCVSSCPAHALDNGFDGLRCREFRMLRGEYNPVGDKGFLPYCRKCMMVCKAGKEISHQG